MRYVEKYLDEDHVSVCAGIIYPKAPTNLEVRIQVESYLNEHALQIVWYADR